MIKVALPLNTEPAYVRAPREEYGTIREIIAEFITVHGVKDAKCVPVNAKNLATEDKQILLKVIEIHPTKAVRNLKESITIHVGREISNMFRAKEIGFANLLDFPVVHHANLGNGAEYPCVYRPSVDAEDSESTLESYELKVDTKASVAYVPDAPVLTISELLDGTYL